MGTILIVDDDPQLRQSFKKLLVEEGHTVATAPNGEAALELVQVNADRYDLVITDQTMPRMSGLQLAEQIGRMSAAPPVVLYTGYADAVDSAKLSAAGVKGLVHKPLEPGELHAVIANYLKRDDGGG